MKGNGVSGNHRKGESRVQIYLEGKSSFFKTGKTTRGYSHRRLSLIARQLTLHSRMELHLVPFTLGNASAVPSGFEAVLISSLP